MSRRILFLAAVFVAVDCSLLGFGLIAVNNKILPATNVTSVKQANTACACRRQCVMDKECTAVTTFETGEGSFECHFSFPPIENGTTHLDASRMVDNTTLVADSRPNVSTLLKVEEPEYPTTVAATRETTTTETTTTEATTTEATTTETTTTTTSPPTNTQTACPAQFVKVGTVGCLFFSTDQMNFAQSQTACTDVGARLASFGVVEDYMQVKDYLLDMADAQDFYWLDIKKVDDTKYEWADGTFLNTTTGTAMWASDEPTAIHHLDCARMIKNKQFLLDNYICSTVVQNYICVA